MFPYFMKCGETYSVTEMTHLQGTHMKHCSTGIGPVYGSSFILSGLLALCEPALFSVTLYYLLPAHLLAYSHNTEIFQDPSAAVTYSYGSESPPLTSWQLIQTTCAPAS